MSKFRPKLGTYFRWSKAWRREICCASFNFQYPLFTLRSSSSCLHLLPLLPITPILPSVFPSVICLRRQFIYKMWPIQVAFIPFIVCRIVLSTLSLCNSFITLSVPLIFSSTTFQNFPGNYDLLSEVSKFHHHSKLCSSCSSSLVSSLNF